MKQVTLYWDENRSSAYYFNGERWRVKSHIGWRDCINQHWKPYDFSKSLTVNNFKEK